MTTTNTPERWLNLIKEIQDTRLRLNKELKIADDSLINACEEYYKSIGIVSGAKVKIIYLYSNDVEYYSEYGIFRGCKISYGRIEPTLYRIKKDGTAHARSTLYIPAVFKIEKAE